MAYSSVVAAELFNGLPGIGGLVKDASNYNNTPVVLVGIFAIGFSAWSSTVCCAPSNGARSPGEEKS